MFCMMMFIYIQVFTKKKKNLFKLVKDHCVCFDWSKKKRQKKRPYSEKICSFISATLIQNESALV